MSIHRLTRKSQPNEPHDEGSAIIQLWLLRLLVPYGAHRKFITKHGFDDDATAEALGLGHWVNADAESWDSAAEDAHTRFKPELVHTELRRLHRQAEANASASDLPPHLSANLEKLALLVELGPVDVSILAFAVMIQRDKLFTQASQWVSNLTTNTLVRVLSVVLDLTEAHVRVAMSKKGVLANTGLLNCLSGTGYDLEDKLELLSTDFADQMQSAELDPVQLLRASVMLCPPPTLALADYPHIEPSLRVALPYLRHALEARKKGVNLFIYGTPGTGKTQLSRVLAKALGCDLFQVSSEDEDGDPIDGGQRLRSFRAAQSMLAQRRVVITFDEAADVFEDGDQFFGRRSTAQTRKAWVNRALEENQIPTLWLSNSIDCLDPAFIRRFDMVIELGIPPRQQRQRVLQEACGDLLPSTAIHRIAESEALAPAVAARAASVVRSIQAELGPEESAQAVERLIGNTLQAQGHAAIVRHDPNRLPETYDPAFLHADADLPAVADGLARSGQGRLCLYGPPGTGKTAYARWLAERLGLPLHVRRGSDLMSKWVGESEKQIASVFRQAEQDKALLLIDEVDSFLQDRRQAQQSWEVTLVNEMLTQIESFSGIFVASTNLMNGLEPAALRRFDLKVGFDYLKPDQAWALLQRQCRVLGLEVPQPEHRQSMDRMNKLTPGDFAAVARQHRFRPVASVAMLVGALEGECALKPGGRAGMGFV